MKSYAILAALVIAGLVFGGCSVYSATHPAPMGVTEIVLKENDFKTVKTHLKGHAECPYLFGFIAMGNPEINSKAIMEIKDQAGAEGKPVQLVNMTKDSTVFNILGIWVVDKVTWTADAIEYTK